MDQGWGRGTTPLEMVTRIKLGAMIVFDGEAAAPNLKTIGKCNLPSHYRKSRDTRDFHLCRQLFRPARACPALPDLVNGCCEPSQQFSKLVLVDQKVEDNRQRAQREHKIPHGQSPTRSPLRRIL
jgi:hypothetical protein